VRRTALLALTIALAGCGDTVEERPRPEPRAAPPQRAELAWRESYPAGGRERLVFAVDTIEVTKNGWTARVAVTNDTGVPFAARPSPGASSYGVMLFATGDLGELEDAASEGRLPAVREAAQIDPAPPRVLAPGVTWRARFTSPGTLPAASHVRVVFGPLLAQGEPPEEMEERVVWITDRSYRLRP
jgi:hypothetical protein